MHSAEHPFLLSYFKTYLVTHNFFNVDQNRTGNILKSLIILNCLIITKSVHLDSFVVFFYCNSIQRNLIK